MSADIGRISPISMSDVSGLGSEASEYAFEAMDAMSNKFDVPVRDFTVVRVTPNMLDVEWPYETSVAVYAAPVGLDRGSWDEIVANTDEFMIDIDKKRLDTRVGMTKAVYGALGNMGFIDKIDYYNEEGVIYPDTFLTGTGGFMKEPHLIAARGQIRDEDGEYQEVTGLLAPTGGSKVFGPAPWTHLPNPNFRVRPAVRIQPQQKDADGFIGQILRNRRRG